MPDRANAVETYLSSTRPGWLRPRAQDSQLELVRKSFAQQLARDATRTIDDRRHRAEVKAAVYNHLTPLLEQHHRSLRELHRFYQKLLLSIGGALIGAVALILMLLIC